MNEIVNGAMSFASMEFMVAAIVGLIVWFFISRASVKSTRQVHLLEALLEEQKRQNALLRRLTDSVAGKEKTTSGSEAKSKDFTRLIPER